MEERRKDNVAIMEHIVNEEQRLTRLEEDIKELRQDIDNLRTDVKDLVEAWRTANGVVAFVKWVAGIVTAIAAIVMFLKTGTKP